MSNSDNYPVSVTIPVAWGEMDSFGHVNNVVYFRYIETSRIAYMEEAGWDFLNIVDSGDLGSCSRRSLPWPSSAR